MWVRIEGKAGEATLFVSVYRPYKNTEWMLTVWNQHVRYFQREKEVEKLDIHSLFIKDLFKELGTLCDKGFHVVLGMDANDDG